MPVPLRGGDLTGAVLHDEDANPIASIVGAGGKRRLCVDTEFGGVIVIPNELTGNVQIQTIETTAALGASATFSGTEHDNIKHEAFAASITLIGGAIGTTVTVNFQQRRSGAGTFRNQDSVVIDVPALTQVNFDRVWSITRQFGRIQLVNNSANALGTTEVIVVRKPIS